MYFFSFFWGGDGLKKECFDWHVWPFAVLIIVFITPDGVLEYCLWDVIRIEVVEEIKVCCPIFPDQTYQLFLIFNVLITYYFGKLYPKERMYNNFDGEQNEHQLFSEQAILILIKVMFGFKQIKYQIIAYYCK